MKKLVPWVSFRWLRWLSLTVAAVGHRCVRYLIGKSHTGTARLILVVALMTLSCSFVLFGRHDPIRNPNQLLLDATSGERLSSPKTHQPASHLPSSVSTRPTPTIHRSDGINNTSFHFKSTHELEKATINGIAINRSLLQFVPNVHVEHINCAKLIGGDRAELRKAASLQHNQSTRWTTEDKDYIQSARDCVDFRRARGYTTEPLSSEEAEFPLAFSILMFKDVAQTERLLRAIYRPQNNYCIHVDKKSADVTWLAMLAISNCFPNVFLAERQFDVRRGTMSVVSAELTCMMALLRVSPRWRYFINLTGQEFPLKTNLDLVRILKSYNGANDISGTKRALAKHRVLFVHDEHGRPTLELKSAPPHGLRLTKGSVHIAASRQFVEYALYNQTARDFLEWLSDTGTPDETFFSSLNYNPQLGVPGADKGDPDGREGVKKPFMTRFKLWPQDEAEWPCHGKRAHQICIFGVGDLATLASRPEMFANKFHAFYEPLAYECLEELHYNRTRQELLGERTFDTAQYASLPFVLNHVT